MRTFPLRARRASKCTCWRGVLEEESRIAKARRDIQSHSELLFGIFLLARHEAHVVGAIALRQLTDNTCELKRFYVRKDHRKQGLGTALLNAVIAQAKSGPWKHLRLDTTSKSPAAISLFRKYGFVVIPRYNDDLFAEIFMELCLH